MDDGAERNVGKEEGVADFRSCVLAGFDLLSYLDAVGGDDVPLLAVGIEYQRNPRGAVGVVFNGLYCGWDAVLGTPEVHDAVFLLVAAADVADGHLAGVVASARLCITKGERLFGLACSDFAESAQYLSSLSRSCRFE